MYLIYLEKESIQVGERGRGRERESQAGSTLSAEPNEELNPMTLGSRLEPK